MVCLVIILMINFICSALASRNGITLPNHRFGTVNLPSGQYPVHIILDIATALILAYPLRVWTYY